MRYLIVNADDFGYSQSVRRAYAELFAPRRLVSARRKGRRRDEGSPPRRRFLVRVPGSSTSLVLARLTLMVWAG
jgi:hypothetical protein